MQILVSGTYALQWISLQSDYGGRSATNTLVTLRESLSQMPDVRIPNRVSQYTKNTHWKSVQHVQSLVRAPAASTEDR